MKFNYDINLDLSLEKYNYCKDRFENLCHQVGILNSNIAYFGEITDIGISDIDALVIGRPKQINNLKYLFEIERQKNNLFSYVFWHKPVFIIDELIDHLSYLHTLKNLNFLNYNSLSSNLIEKKDNLILHHVWWSFISIFIVGILKSKNVSLRFVAMIQKNLSTTEKYFSKQDNLLDDITTIFRNKILNYKITDNLNSFFLDQLSRACNSIEKFQKTDEVPYSYKFVPNRSTICLSSKLHKFSNISFLKMIHIPMMYNQLGLQYLDIISLENEFTSYIERSKNAQKICFQQNIEYPFISPFCLNVENNNFLKQINKFLNLN